MLLADAANATPDGKLNVLGAFEAVFAASYPATHASMTVVIRLTASPAERGQKKQVAILIIDEDGHNLAKIDAETEVPNSIEILSPTLTLMLAVQNLVLPKSGTYSFHLLVNGESKGSRSFRANLLPSTTTTE